MSTMLMRLWLLFTAVNNVCLAGHPSTPDDTVLLLKLQEFSSSSSYKIYYTPLIICWKKVSNFEFFNLSFRLIAFTEIKELSTSSQKDLFNSLVDRLEITTVSNLEVIVIKG